MAVLAPPEIVKADNIATGLADPSLLEKIDKLFACNVGDHVDLPQLVVVGDQSSGKSSVLEALTRLPFPRESTLCTRFATQITFRRSHDIGVAASIIPSPNSSVDHQRAVREWRRENLRALDPATFASIMEEVNKVMEFKADSYGKKSQFSTDILRLEIKGRDQEHLSVIDVPGLFQRHKEGVTSKADIELVRSMVYGYMHNPRSVMLTVVPANVDIATQGILEKAEEFDPEGIRTLGVLTKPDLVDKGAEHNVVDLIIGKEHQLSLGWHLLRNAGQAELSNSIESRQEEERIFFDTVDPWKDLDKDKIGISSFRLRLQEVLSAHIRREFPKVKSDIAKRLKSCKQSLQRLGAKRQTAPEQYQYLTDVSMNFQKIMTEALNANYGRHDMFKKHSSLRLVTKSVNRSEQMSLLFEWKGHSYSFDGSSTKDVRVAESTNADFVNHETTSDEKSEPETEEGDDSTNAESPEEDDENVGAIVTPSEGTVPVRLCQDHPDVEDLLPETSKVAEPERRNILEWLANIHREARGFEIGTINPSLLATSMKEQSHKWQNLALGYVADVIVLTHTFIVDLLHEVCPATRVYDGIKSLLMDELASKYKRAIDHTSFLLDVELNGTPSTLNHYFNDTLQKCRQSRMQKQLREKEFSAEGFGRVIRAEDLFQHNHMSNDEHTTQDLHDILQSYYKVARKRFVDNLRMQVADHFLISGPDTPLTLFSPKFVASLTHEQLEEAAGEDHHVKRQRAALEREMHDLEEARKILR